MSNPGLTAHTDKAHVLFQQIDLLYRTLPVGLLGTLITSSALMLIQYSVIPPGQLFGWYGILLTLTAIRFWLYIAYRRTQPSPESILPWQRRFVAGVLFAGICWGSTALLLFPAGDLVHQVFLTFVLGGMVSAAITTLSSRLSNLLAFVLPALIPLIVRLLAEGTMETQAMAGLTFLFMLLVILGGYRNHRTLIEALSLQSVHSVTEQVLAQTAEQNRLILESTAEGIFGVDLDGTTTFVNPAAARMLGYAPDELIGRPIHAAIHHSYPEGAEADQDDCPPQLSFINGLSPHSANEIFLRKDGSSFPVEYYSTPILKDNQINGAVVSFSDISERHESEKALRESEQAYRTLSSNIPGIIYRIDIADQTALRFFNNLLHSMTGYRTLELVEEALSPFESIIVAEDREQARRLIERAISENRPFEVEYRVRHQNGLLRHFLERGRPVIGENTGLASIDGVVLDITERKQAEAQIAYEANYDQLTDLPNRRLLLKRLRTTIDLCAKQHHALLFIDLDRFKAINDSLGHDIGDRLLHSVAQRLLNYTQSEDVSAHLGGDEFAILLNDLNDDANIAAAQAFSVAEDLRETLTEPHLIDKHRLHTTPSIGIRLFTHGDRDAEALLREADIAMYRAKEKGRNAIQIFTPSMHMAVHERLTLENDLRQALQDSELSLHFQPQVRANGRVIGAEALLRWRHPQRGTISPASFIPLAEDSGLILSIGDWLVETASRQLKKWSELGPGYQDLKLAINISPRQFRQHDFSERVISIITKHAIKPSRLELEITEGVVIADIEDSIRKMEHLREYGISFAVDDFGTGYSSLNYLHRLPLDKLKIDRSFIRKVHTNHDNATIVETIIAMAHHLELEVIAEGVSKSEQLHFLMENGCQTYQGHLFKPALAVEEFQHYALEQNGIGTKSDYAETKEYTELLHTLDI